MASYLLLLHERPADNAAISTAEMAEIVQRYAAWARELGARGQLVGGEKLCDEGGRLLRLSASGTSSAVLASDGPYAEAQDVIGGYFVISADNDSDAEALAATCPHLRGSQWIEIRRIEVLG
jgi:hypothetical protein